MMMMLMMMVVVVVVVTIRVQTISFHNIYVYIYMRSPDVTPSYCEYILCTNLYIKTCELCLNTESTLLNYYPCI